MQKGKNKAKKGLWGGTFDQAQERFGEGGGKKGFRTDI